MFLVKCSSSSVLCSLSHFEFGLRNRRIKQSEWDDGNKQEMMSKDRTELFFNFRDNESINNSEESKAPQNTSGSEILLTEKSMVNDYALDHFELKMKKNKMNPEQLARALSLEKSPIPLCKDQLADNLLSPGSRSFQSPDESHLFQYAPSINQLHLIDDDPQNNHNSLMSSLGNLDLVSQQRKTLLEDPSRRQVFSRPSFNALPPLIPAKNRKKRVSRPEKSKMLARKNPEEFEDDGVLENEFDNFESNVKKYMKKLEAEDKKSENKKKPNEENNLSDISNISAIRDEPNIGRYHDATAESVGFIITVRSFASN